MNILKNKLKMAPVSSNTDLDPLLFCFSCSLEINLTNAVISAVKSSSVRGYIDTLQILLLAIDKSLVDLDIVNVGRVYVSLELMRFAIFSPKTA